MMQSPYFAVFAVARMTASDGSTFLCATTRPDGTIGLPGGKVDDGEMPYAAVIREAREEGWELNLLNFQPIHVAQVDGKPVAWFDCKPVCGLQFYKEKHRGITPIIVAPVDLSPGFGNEFLID